MRMVRIHRASIQKLIYSECFKCLECKLNLARQRLLLQHFHSSLSFIFSRHSRCPQCRSTAVHRLPKRDHIDSLASNPLGLVQALVRAPLNKCPPCRLQFYDWRRPHPNNRAGGHAPGSDPKPGWKEDSKLVV
jgi:hypothetical protein